MAYIDKSYWYYEQFPGQMNITDAEFAILAAHASDIVDSITQYRIVQGGGLSALPPLLQDMVKKAVAAQVLFFIQNGIETVLTGESGKGFTVGKVRVDGKSTSDSSKGNSAAQSMISPLTISLLEQTGLMGRDVACLGPYRSSFLGIW